MTTTSPELQRDRRRDPRAAAVRALLARAARRRFDRLAARDGLRAARARQGRRSSSTPTRRRAPLMAFPGVPDIEIADRGRRRVRRRDHHGVRRPRAHRRRRARARRSSSTSITIPATPATAQINWFDASAAACGEMVFDLMQRARRAADARDRDAHLPRDPDRHRLVSLLEHLAADVRHLPRAARGGRRSGAASRATSTTATTWAG